MAGESGEKRRFADYRKPLNRTELERSATVDDLTGLRNKKSLNEDLTRELSLFQRGSSDFAFAYVDVDNFKKINDAVGHDSADNVLKAAAKAFRSVLRSTDTAYRDHGDEFQLIMRAVDPDKLPTMERDLKEKIREIFHQKMLELGNPIFMEAGLSFGFSFPRKNDRISDITNRADANMRQDKTDRKMGR